MKNNIPLHKEKITSENPSFTRNFLNSSNKLKDEKKQRAIELKLYQQLRLLLCHKQISYSGRILCLDLISSHLGVKTGEDFIEVVRSIIRRQPDKLKEFKKTRNLVRAIREKEAKMATEK